jgi:tRNA/tmRNA/rRNA uracil-C5-methylase (TrmA/RlmC/RlmD family)
VCTPLPHFGVCGGCQQQHASTELQQKAKAARWRVCSNMTLTKLLPMSPGAIVVARA